MRRRILSTFTITLAVTLFAACDRANPVAPPMSATPPSAVSKSLLGTLLGAPTTINPLLRITPLATNLTGSGTVGLLGAVIVIPGAGFSVIVPPLAAPLGTHITVTALAGSKVAYEFAPHGLHFLLPLVATQDLHNTQARTGGLVSPLSLSVGYFPDSTNVTSITELLNVNVNLLNQTAVTTIWHFSGYIYAGGSDDGSDGGGN
jgi:hypothetical protein